MEFDSHTGAIVALAVAMVNELSPGWRRGKEYDRPPDLIDATGRAIASVNASWASAPDDDEAAKLAAWAAELHEVVRHVDARELDPACAALNKIMRDAHAVPTLTRHDTDPWHLHFHTEDAPWAQQWAAGMATALAIVIGNPSVDRLGICTAPHCDRVYVDTSRNGTKRFCSTACQNRVKAAAFRARRG